MKELKSMKQTFPTVKEMKAFRQACPSVKELDRKIEREEEKESKNIETIFDKKKKRKPKKN